MTRHSKTALRLATIFKSIGGDLSDVLVDEGFHEVPRNGFDLNGIVPEAFDALMDEVEEALPAARYDNRIARVWAQAGADIFAERHAERMAFSLE